MSDQITSPDANTDLAREIAHILFIDTVGYSKLTINEQREIQESLKRIVRETNCFRSAEAAGKLIRLPTGDGMALVFADNIEAPLHCALEISEALRSRPDLPIRMGIHSGPVSRIADVNDRVNIAGAGINTAQRVMSCGDAGHILLSNRVADDVAAYREWQPYLHDLGEYEFKHGLRLHVFNLWKGDLGNPAVPAKLRQRRRAKRDADSVRPTGADPRRLKVFAAITLILSLIALAIISASIFRRGSSPPSAAGVADKSIAVLPFENHSDDKENAYFADAIQDEILTRLSKIADLKVISRTSTQQYKSSPGNLSAIARQLGVAHVLEGSVQKSGGIVRVNVQLIKAANDSHIWADTFDRQLSDILLVESEIAKTIADQLRVRLTGLEEQAIVARPTDNSAAYDAYLRGLAYTLKTLNTPASSLGADKYLREAVLLDPKFAQAWALLSYVDALGYISTNLQPTIALREEARQAAETAISLQPHLGEAVLAKGYYYYACLKDYETALRYFEQARQFLPNSSRVPESLAYVARRQGRWDVAESYFTEAERLDPRNVSLLTQHGLLHIARRRFPDAVGKLDQVLDITPDDVDTLALKAAIAQAEGDLPRAAALLTPLHPDASNVGALETQVYQAILQRRPGETIPRLKELLVRPDSALGYYNGELRFWLGWLQSLAGDGTAAQQTWRQARSELEPFLKEQPGNPILIGDLALINMGLGEKAAALALAERAMAANPTEKDAIAGPGTLEILARVASNSGQHDRAIEALQRLLSLVYAGPLATQDLPLTRALLRFDPMFDPLRSDPRFQKLLASPARD